MNINDLNHRLSVACDHFAGEINSLFPADSSNHPTNAEIHQFAERVNDVLGSFQDEIINYLKEH